MALNKDRIFKAADNYIRKNRIDRAIAEYETWLRENPKDWNIIRTVGDLYARINRNDEAIKKYSIVAGHYRRDGFNVRAIATYKMVLRLDANNEAAMRNLAELQAEEGLLMEAKHHYNTLVEFYNKQGHKRLAAEIFKKLTEIDPQDLKIRYRYADFLTKAGRTTEAAQEYVGIADQLIGQAQVDDAIKILEQGLVRAANEPSLKVKLAQAFSLKGRHDQAVETLEGLRMSLPDDGSLLAILGEAYLASGNVDDAEGVFKQLIDLEPKNPANVLRLVDLRLAQGALDSALEELSPLVDSRVADGEGKEATGLLQKILGKDPHHINTLLKLAEVQTILKQESARIAAYDSLCEAYGRAGEFEKAVQVAEKLVEIDPESAQHKDRLKFLKSKIGRPAPEAPSVVEPQPVDEEVDLPDFSGLEQLSTQIPEFGEANEPVESDEAARAVNTSPALFDLGEVVELTQEDEENIKEKLTEAEVFVRYGLVEKAVDQLLDVLESFRFHIESRAKLIEIYVEHGMTHQAAEQLLNLADVYERLERPEEARSARGRASQLNPDLAARDAPHVAATSAGLALDDEIELTLSDEEDSDFDDGIEIDSDRPYSAEESSIDELPASVDDALVDETAVDFSMDDLSADPDAFGIEVDSAGQDLSEDRPEIGDEIGVEAEGFEVSIDETDSGPDELAPVEAETAGEHDLSESEVDVDLDVSSADIPFVIEEAPGAEAEPTLQKDDVPEAPVAEEFSVDLGDEDEVEVEIPDTVALPEADDETLPEHRPVARLDDTSSELAEHDSDVEVDVTAIEDAIEIPDWGEPEPFESPSQPAAARLPASAVEASPIASELTEVDEYIALGLYEDARDTLKELLRQHPDDASVLSKIEEVGFSVEQIAREASERRPLAIGDIAEAADSGARADEIPGPSEQAFPLEEEPSAVSGIESLLDATVPADLAPARGSSDDGDFIDLASELSDEIFGTHVAVEDEEIEPEGPLTDPGLDQIFREFRKGVEKQLGTEDYDTRYNLGIAYKEMGLLDEAIAEFQLAAKDEVRGLECYSMLGLCFMEKGMPEIAIKWFSKGLDIPNRREEEYHGLRYDLAQAFEAASEPERALTLYLEIFKENASFRDVKDRLRELQAAQK
ncbi:MAG TPA: tetratricopeptide repeat protein [Vicinamibacteria bacterium]|nr:tetratricopeptide repeat protein [Vicinamibacteria bacterium]